MTTLMRCPFCKISQVDSLIVDNYHGTIEYRVSCGACGSHSPSFKTESKAALFWNTRSQRTKCNCPICDNNVDLSTFQIKEHGRLYYKYECNHCHFESGFSHDKKLIVRTWKC